MTPLPHRNVIFANEHVPAAPADAVHFLAPPDLWTQLDATCTGACDVVTIPHNSNLSEGESLKVWDPTPAGVAQQAKYQVSAEIYQHEHGRLLERPIPRQHRPHGDAHGRHVPAGAARRRPRSSSRRGPTARRRR